MITAEIIARINELAKKQRAGALSATEKDEQARLRRLYIDNIKEQVKTVLDASIEHQHDEDCDCGCHHEHHE